MAYTFGWLNGLGLAAGVLILALGAFVLYARPRSNLNRAFFVFAIFDGMSSLVFELGAMANTPFLKSYYKGVFVWLLIGFLASLAVFGLSYPRPLGGEKGRRRTLWVTGGLAATAMIVYALRHDWFFEMLGRSVVLNPAYWAVFIFQYPLVTLIVWKLAREVRTAPSVRDRQEAVFFLAATLMAFGTSLFSTLAFFVDTAPETLVEIPRSTLDGFRWGVFISGVLTLGALVPLRHEWDRLEPVPRALLMVALASLALVPPLQFFSEGGFATAQILGLVAYPLLLAYAIVSKEAFDVNPQVRRAAAFTAAGALFAAGFVIGEDFLQDVLADGFLGDIASDTVVQAISAVLAAMINFPIFLGARRLANRVLPRVIQDPKHVQNLATYRLVLEGALEDGILGEQESRALVTLRRELGVSLREHQEMVEQVQIRAAEQEASLVQEPPPGDADGV